MTLSEIWGMIAGLGLFVYGMFHLEESLKQMEGRTFKLFLRKHTKNKISAIFSGTLVTGVMQSSSIVNLLVLSFVGAGMITMRNALGVVLGANIGGTFNSWLLALIGFKMDLGLITLPITGIAGIAMVVFKDNATVFRISKFFMGFGLLFMGLDFMKSSMDNLITHFDFKPYLDYPLIVFVLIGFVITALIQTSSATIVIVLSAVYATIIPLNTAIAVVLGAELGTTIKILIGSVGGIAAKKRVAWGNFIFNLITTSIGFIFLVPLVKLVTLMGIQDPVVILVAFQTLINIIGAILFYYFLNAFADFLEKRFNDTIPPATLFIKTVITDTTQNAVEMVEKEVELFINRVIELNLEMFHVELNESGISNEKTPGKDLFPAATDDYFKRYNLIKQAEGEIFSFYAGMGEKKIDEKDLLRLNRLMGSVRNAMYSLKGMKDIGHDRKELSNSANDIKFEMYNLLRKQLTDFYKKLNSVLLLQNQSGIFENLVNLLKDNRTDFDLRMKRLYEHAGNRTLRELDISTLFNINRELYSSCQAIILSVKDFLLDAQNADSFENLPPVVSK